MAVGGGGGDRGSKFSESGPGAVTGVAEGEFYGVSRPVAAVQQQAAPQARQRPLPEQRGWIALRLFRLFPADEAFPRPSARYAQRAARLLVVENNTGLPENEGASDQAECEE